MRRSKGLRGDANTALWVDCTLPGPNGRECGKRCQGEKRYRSMQEHIRRAHPDRWHTKLPATEETIRKMMGGPLRQSHTTMLLDHAVANPLPPVMGSAGGHLSAINPAYMPHDTTLTHGQPPLLGSPDPRRLPPGHYPVPPGQMPHSPDTYYQRHGRAGDQSGSLLSPEARHYRPEYLGQQAGPRRPSAEVRFPVVNAAEALAQLQSTQPRIEVDRGPPAAHSDSDDRSHRSALKLPPIKPIVNMRPPRSRSTLPSISHLGLLRPAGIEKRSHRRGKSLNLSTAKTKQLNSALEQLPSEDRALETVESEVSEEDGSNHSDKDNEDADGNEQEGVLNPREQTVNAVSKWEELVNAAENAATENAAHNKALSAPQRHSMPPVAPTQPQHHYPPPQSYRHPLQCALTPPTHATEARPEDFTTSYTHYHRNPNAALLGAASAGHGAQGPVAYCAMCRRPVLIRDVLQCSDCLCGVCQPCVHVLVHEQGALRQCPKCKVVGGKFKVHQLDLQ